LKVWDRLNAEYEEAHTDGPSASLFDAKTERSLAVL
jgi:hypothetical protein